MPDMKAEVLGELERRFGQAHKLPGSNSLYEFEGTSPFRVYFRYSKDHGQKTFYGLRQTDLMQLEGRCAVICFMWDGQPGPLFVPFQDYEEVFRESSPASDGQYKVQVYPLEDSVELFVARVGRFNVDAYLGWHSLDSVVVATSNERLPELSHGQIQSILGAIGTAKGCDIWIPPNNRLGLDTSLAREVRFRDQLPQGLTSIAHALSEVDAIWLDRGSGNMRSLFEVEHSTPIYSGLLRFNDFFLTVPTTDAQFTVVSNEERRALFVRQLHRPTFKASRLHERCTFMPYSDVYRWFQRVVGSSEPIRAEQTGTPVVERSTQQ